MVGLYARSLNTVLALMESLAKQTIREKHVNFIILSYAKSIPGMGLGDGMDVK